MTDVDMFERSLMASLRAYAADAPTLDDPAAFARLIAVEHPRRRAWLTRPLTRSVGWVLIGAALILATIVALAVAGGSRPPSDPLLVPRNPMPDELFGVRTSGGYSLDVNDTFLLRGPNGEPLEWAGSAVEFVPRIGDVGDLVIAAAEPCGEGRYSIRTDSPPDGGVPAPSASGGNPTPVPGVTPLELVGEGRPFVLVPITDACADRFAILTSGPWEPERVELVAGQRYDSMDFTEPFDFIMPFADPNMALAGEGSLTKGVLRLGNGDNWSSSFHDDVPVFADVCDTRSAMLNDVPATPEDVGAWLRSSGDLIVADPTELTVDGRTALAFLTTPLEGCESFDPPLRGTQFHLGNAVYAIPTGDDTILYVVWGVPRDDLVSSITFK